MDDVPNNDDGGFGANMTGSATVASLVYAEACLKVARFLLTVYLNGKLDSHTLSLLMRGVITPSSSSSPSSPSPSPPPSLPATPISLTHPQHHLGSQDKCGVERWDVGLWVTRVWEATVSNLTVIDQVTSIGINRRGRSSHAHLLNLLLLFDRVGLYRSTYWHKWPSSTTPLAITARQLGWNTKVYTLCSPFYSTSVQNHLLYLIVDLPVSRSRKWIAEES